MDVTKSVKVKTSYATVNKNIFGSHLQVLSVGSAGSQFQARGPATEKASVIFVNENENGE